MHWRIFQTSKDLDKITLTDLLSGQTKYPVSLKDFQHFLTTVSRDPEVLAFWMEIATVRAMYEDTLALKTSYEEHLNEFRKAAQFSITTAIKATSFLDKTTGRRHKDVELNMSAIRLMAPTDNENEFWSQYMHYLKSAFVLSDAQFEVNLPAQVRDQLLQDFIVHESTPAPIILRQAQMEMYNLLVGNGFPRFIGHATRNLTATGIRNRYIVGTVLLIVSITAYVVLLSIQTIPRSYRLLLFILFFVSFIVLFEARYKFCCSGGIMCVIAVATPSGADQIKVQEPIVRRMFRLQVIRLALWSAGLAAIIELTALFV